MQTAKSFLEKPIKKGSKNYEFEFPIVKATNIDCSTFFGKSNPMLVKSKIKSKMGEDITYNFVPKKTVDAALSEGVGASVTKQGARSKIESVFPREDPVLNEIHAVFLLALEAAPIKASSPIAAKIEEFFNTERKIGGCPKGYSPRITMETMFQSRSSDGSWSVPKSVPVKQSSKSDVFYGETELPDNTKSYAPHLDPEMQII